MLMSVDRTRRVFELFSRDKLSKSLYKIIIVVINSRERIIIAKVDRTKGVSGNDDGRGAGGGQRGGTPIEKVWERLQAKNFNKENDNNDRILNGDKTAF